MISNERRRSGFTLIELLVVMSVAAALLAITVGWIHFTMRYASAIKERQRNHITSTRLAWELRESIQDSQSMDLFEGKKLVLTNRNAQTTTWTIDGNSVLLERQGESNRQRDVYEFSSSSLIHWDSTELPNWVSLVVTRGREGSRWRAENQEGQDVEMDLLPTELHVRAGPKRWPVPISTEPFGQEKEAK